MKSCLLIIVALTKVVTALIPLVPFHKNSLGLKAIQDDSSTNIHLHEAEKNTKDVNRRLFVETATASLVASTLFSPKKAYSADDESSTSKFKKYEDEFGFEVSIPESWSKSDQDVSELDRRNIVLFVDPDSSSSMNGKTLIFIAYTAVAPDYTSLGSFGSVDQVAQATVLPKSKTGGNDKGVESELMSAVAANSAYYFDYTITPENLDKIHFRSVFYLSQGSTGGAGSYLITVTAQTPQAEYSKRKETFDQIISSFRKSTKKA